MIRVPKSPDKKGGVSLRLLLGIALLGLLSAFLWAQAPQWWYQAYTGGNAPVRTTGTNDYAAVNQGQLKNIATSAVAELDATLPGGAGDTLHTLVNKWSTLQGDGTRVENSGSNTNDYVAVNLGQLKTVTKPFYDRLYDIGYTGAPLTTGQKYPWTGKEAAANDYAMANIGQVKNLFSFDLTVTSANGLPDWWQQYYFHGIVPNVNAPAPSGILLDGTAVTILQAYQNGINPIDYYNGQAPSLTIVSGNNQTAVPGAFANAPLVVQVKNSTTGLPMSNGPVTFAVTQGGGQLASGNVSGTAATGNLGVRTDSAGLAQVYFYAGMSSGTSTISASAGSGTPLTFSEVISESNLVLYYKLDDGLLDPNATTASDVCGNNTGILENSPLWTAGIYGGALQFTPQWEDWDDGGQPQDVRCAAPTNLDIGQNSFTISVWFKTDSSSGGRFVSKEGVANDGHSAQGFYFGLTSNGQVEAALKGSASSWNNIDFCTQQSFNDNQWHHAVVAFDQTNRQSRIYLDGVAQSLSQYGNGGSVNAADPSEFDFPNSTDLSATSNAPLLIANDPNSYYSYEGTLDDIRIYKMVLTAAQIRDLGDSDHNGFPDWWEYRYFGHIGVDPNADPDGDGLTNLQEYQNGTDPTDYYNGQTPVATLASGDNQIGLPGSFTTAPLVVHVTDQNNQPLTNAPVSFTVQYGGGKLAASLDTQATLAGTLISRTDSNGNAQAYYQEPEGSAVQSVIQVSVGTASALQFTSLNSTLAGEWKFDEGAGMVASDSLGYGDNGILKNGVAWTVSFDGSGALQFDGQSGYVEAPDSNALKPGSGPLSVTAWVQLASGVSLTSGSNVYDIVSKIASGENGFELALNGGASHGLIAKVYNGANTQQIVSETDNTAVISDGNWHHVAFVRDQNGTGTLYLDGQVAGTQTGVTGSADSAQPLWIGRGANGGYFNGIIDHVVIKRAAMTASDIAAAFNQDSDGNGLPDWWEHKYFGYIGVNPNAAAPNRSGSTILQAYQQGVSPLANVTGTNGGGSTPNPGGGGTGPQTDGDHSGQGASVSPPSLWVEPTFDENEDGSYEEDDTTAHVQWGDPGDVANIDIQRRDGSGSWKTVGSVTSGTDYKDSGLLANVSYQYRLSITYQNGQTVLSESAEYNVPLFKEMLIKQSSLSRWKLGTTEFTNPSSPPKYYLIEQSNDSYGYGGVADYLTIGGSGSFWYKSEIVPHDHLWNYAGSSDMESSSYDSGDDSEDDGAASSTYQYSVQNRTKSCNVSTSQGRESSESSANGEPISSGAKSCCIQATYVPNSGVEKWLGNDYDLSKGTIVYSGSSQWDGSWDLNNYVDVQGFTFNPNIAPTVITYDWSYFSSIGSNWASGWSESSIVLSQEYTTDAFISDLIYDMPDYPDDFTDSWFLIASRNLNQTEDHLSITKARYKYGTNPSAQGTIMTFYDVFVPDADPDDPDNPQSPQVVGTHTFAGGLSVTETSADGYEIDPTSKPDALAPGCQNGKYYVVQGSQLAASGAITDGNGVDPVNNFDQTEKTDGSAVLKSADTDGNGGINGSFNIVSSGVTDSTYTLSWTNGGDFSVIDNYTGNPIGSGHQITQGDDYSNFTIVANSSSARIGETITITLTATDANGNPLGTDKVVFTVIGTPRNYTIPFDEASGDRYRKIGLNGRPLSDEKPHHTAESDQEKEETYIDALTLGLRHSTTDVYVPVAGSDLAITARRNIQSEVWNMQSGLRPHERFDRPFGAGWNSNLCANLEYVNNTDDGVTYYYVTDQNGASHRFIQVSDGSYVPLPSDSRENGDYLTSFDGSTFTDRYGTKITFNYGVSTNQSIATARNKTSGTEYHYHYGVSQIVDRFGNQLNYAYPPNANTLIPSTITLNGHPDQTLYIRQDGRGHITQIWDPNGNQYQFAYNSLSYPDAATNSGNAQYSETVLSSVTGPDGKTTAYDYDFAVEPDDPKNDNPVDKYHIDVKSIADPLGNTYAFTYQFDQTKWDYSTSNGYFRQTGAPRNIKTVQLPGNLGTTRFTNNSTVRLTFTGNTPSVSGDSLRQMWVEDTEGSTTTYTFGVGNGSSQVFNVGGLYPNTPSFAVPKIVFYKDMKIDYGNAGSELFTFDPTAGLALSSVKDFSGNTTSYVYGDTYSPSAAAIYSKVFPYQGFFTNYSDPTSQTDALGNTKAFHYGAYRIMDSVTDENGRLKTYQLDSLGRRVNEVIYAGGDTGSAVVQETDFAYGSTAFPAVVTQKTVRNLGGPSWVGDLVKNYELDVNGRVAKEIVNPGGLNLTTSYFYDGNGNKLSATDPLGKTTWFSYDSRNRLSTATYADFTQKQLYYDNGGNKTDEQDENGHWTHNVYDALNRLTEVHRIMEAGKPDLVTKYTYNNVNSRTSVTDPNGKQTSMYYDSLQRLTSTVTPGDAITASGTTTFVYDSTANCGGNPFDTSSFKPTTTIDAAGYVTTVVYDALYRPTSKSIAYGSGTSTTQTGYDNVGNPTSQVDPLGKLTSTQFDALDRPVQVIYADGSADSGTTQAFYTTTGLKWKTVDENQNATLTHYDGAGRPDYVVAPPVFDALSGTPNVSGTAWTVYDNAGNMVAKINPLLARWDYAFDVRNRKIAELAPPVLVNNSGTAVRPLRKWDYDFVGNVTRVTENFTGAIDGNGSIAITGTGAGDPTDTSYDFANRAVMVQGPAVVDGLDGTTKRPITTSTYDSTGNITDVIDPDGNLTHNVYDALNRIKSTTDGAGNTVQYDYDLVGNRVKVTDGNLNATQFGYDGLQRNTTVTDILGGTTTYDYDALNKTGRQDANGATTSYAYDDRERLKTVTYAQHPEDNRVYYYDPVGNLLNVTESGRSGKANVTYTYDALNRVTSENSEGAFAPGTGQCSDGLTHSYGYDLAGNRVVAQYAGDTVPINYSYDAENRLSGIAENGRATAYGYDLVGDVTRKTLPNGDIETMCYDAMRRMTSESGTSGAGVAQYGYAYTHDLAGNLYSIQESSLGAYNQYQSFSYDGANRLTDETSTAFGPKHYSYDGANNRTSFTDPATGAVVSCSYNALNQIVSLSENGSGAKSVTFGYDLNGNRLTRTSSGTTNQYSYDGENRLTGLTTGSNGIAYAYTYDYRTRRVERVENGVRTKVVFSGGVSVKEYAEATNTATVEYIRGHEMGGGVGGIVYSNRSGGLSFDHYNIRGDVVATTAVDGSKTWQGWYDAFGTHSHESGMPPTDRQRANTKDEDAWGGLNEGMRYRDLETGVFLTKDPIGNNLMMPKEKWMVDGKEVTAQQYVATLTPGVPQAGNGPTKSAQDSGDEADAHVAASAEGAVPGQKSHMHTAAAGFPNFYTYVNENPWTFFDPEGLDAQLVVVRDGGQDSPGTMYMFENGRYVGSARVNENGYMVKGEHGLKNDSHGIPASQNGTEYKILPKNNYTEGDQYKQGQPSVTAPQYADPNSKDYAPGRAGEGYKKGGTVRVHNKSGDGSHDSTGCLTTDPAHVQQVTDLMNNNMNSGGTTAHVYTAPKTMKDKQGKPIEVRRAEPVN